MLLQYDDPTESVRRFPYQKQADGSWKKLGDPNDKGGDDNVYYEDKFAMIWNIGNSIKNFGQMGCMAACHAGEPGKPFGNKYTASEGELGDIWHMKSIRTGYIGQVDDQYLDHTRYDKEKSPEAGRKSDPKTGGGYADIKLVNGKPEFMHKSGLPANKPGGTYYLREEDKVPFDDSKFKAGDEVASILVAPFTGDRGEIAVAIKWGSGKWTSVMSRKLVTGSKYDVQFDNLGATYEFGLGGLRQCPGAPRRSLRRAETAICEVGLSGGGRRSRRAPPVAGSNAGDFDEQEDEVPVGSRGRACGGRDDRCGSADAGERCVRRRGADNLLRGRLPDLQGAMCRLPSAGCGRF